jgi:hypothetical protein
MKFEDSPVFQPNYMRNAVSRVVKVLANGMMNMFVFYAKNSNNTDWMNGYLAAIDDLNAIAQSVQKEDSNERNDISGL